MMTGLLPLSHALSLITLATIMSLPILFDENNVLRSGWRFAIFLFAFVLATVVLGAITFGAMIALGFSPNEGLSYLVVNSVISLIPALVLGWLCTKYLERLPIKALGAHFTRFWFSHLLLGLFIGAITVAVAVVICFAAGGLRFTPNSIPTAVIAQGLVTSFALFAVAAAFEEALFRGYILQTFARSDLAAFAIAMTSVFFGALHLGNPNVGAISTINTMIAGVWFGLAYLKTRDLWFVWGLHLIWNWLQGAVFGIEVSGLTDITKASLFVEVDHGPVWLTGGQYGIEGGIACTVALLLSTVTIRFLPLLKPDAEMLELTSPKRLSARIIKSES